MDEESIKQAFSRVKQDIVTLNDELTLLRSDISQIYTYFTDISSEINGLKNLIKEIHEELNTQKMYELATLPIPSNFEVLSTNQQTNRQINTTNQVNPTQNPTIPQEIGGLKSQNITFSTGNEGVPTDRQTARQSDKQTDILRSSEDFSLNPSFSDKSIDDNLADANIILNSLDRLKKEIRQKFKRLTPQEMAVFSAIYQSEDTDPENTTYRELAKKLKLSESSIRDYTLRIISKGIPIKKQKIDNKKILLSISSELKKIATLSTIMQLRDI